MSAQERHSGDKRPWMRFLNMATLCILCIALNIVGAQAALALKLPVFLDSTGTMLAGILGGYAPAVIVGYLTNLINGISDSSTIYYGIVNVFIALAAAFFAKRGWFKKLPLILLSIPIFTLIGGGVGSILTFFLYGIGFGDGVSAPFAHQLYEDGVFDVFGAQLCADMFVDFIDKSLTVLFVALVYHLMSEDFLAKVDFIPWRQAPLDQAELDETMSTKPRGMSLQTKFIVVITSLMTLVAVTATAISYATFHQSMINTESSYASGLIDLLEQQINPDRIDDYLTYGEDVPGYRSTENQLAEARDSFPGVQYVYVYQVQEDGCHVVFDPDTADEVGSDPGEVVPFDPAIQQQLPALLAGEKIEPVVSNDSYGWLLTVYEPVKNSAGDTVCYLAIDISMAQLVSDEAMFLASVIALFAAFFVLVCAIILWLARYGIILPINSIARASSNFMMGDESSRSISATKIDALDIRTGDEIENMYDAVNQMSQEAVRYTTDAQEKSEVIERMQDNLIMVMADLVESRDKFTGDHVRNTATYTKVIMNQMRREGIYPDQLTNEFISNVYNSAPLHDIGKIQVSDAILNKPGRLTDEEFEIMKTHTTAGAEIISRAIDMVSEENSGYLKEAMNLAHYHHEKWNGQGYPCGLAGEDIPLSARIMAVADVFDALVSRRSYKEGFPFEKAMGIIREGSGSHFDPKVVEAFVRAQDEVKRVMNTYMGG